MMERVKYINHIKEEMNWGDNGIFVNYNTLRDFSWEYSSENNIISGFRKGIVSKTVPIIIYCKNAEEGLAKKNRLFEVCEKDVVAVQHGKIFIGDSYLKCYVTGSKKSNYLMHKGYLETTLTVTTDFPSWVKETKTVFRSLGSGDEAGTTGGKNFDFNYDFPHDYTSEMNDKRLNNSGFVDTAFQLIIYGACTNPAISINGHTYQVNVELSDNEFLTVDSMTRKIILTKYDGTQVNCFSKRSRDSYVFEPIPPGNNVITWNGAFGFDVILLDERSEPKWI
jgi:hypothetical protein